MFWTGGACILLPSVKNYEGPEMLLTCKPTSYPATVPWMLAEDVRLLGQRQRA